MKIVYFGTFSTAEGYPRNDVVAAAIEAAGSSIINCRRDAWGDAASRAREAKSFLAAAARLMKLLAAWSSLAVEYLFRVPDHDLILVGYPGHLDVFIAKILGSIRRKPVVLDAFLSLHEAIVDDRKIAAPRSIKAKMLKFLDWAGCAAADAVLIDTASHIDYYRDVIGAKPEKFISVFVGAVEKYFHPVVPSPPQISGEILFFGSFLPLHGADVIVGAAGILKDCGDIKFTMIGDGPEWNRCKQLADSIGAKIDFIREWVSYPDLADRIARSEICLGIFSDGPKASRVIPCKVFNVLAMGKPLITADTAAVKGALENGKHALLVAPGDPAALADAILELHRDEAERKKIADAGLDIFSERFSIKSIGRNLLADIENRFGPKAS